MLRAADAAGGEAVEDRGEDVLGQEGFAVVAVVAGSASRGSGSGSASERGMSMPERQHVGPVGGAVGKDREALAVPEHE